MAIRKRSLALIAASAATVGVLLTAADAFGGQFYVSPDGSDGADGSAASPWQTLGRAAAAAGPGDTVTVAAGTYGESVELTRPGRRGARITFRGAPGQRPILDGGGELSGGFTVKGYTTVRGFEIRRFSDIAVSAWETADALRFQDLRIHDNGGGGIRISNSRGTRVRDVVMERNASGGFDCTPVPRGGPGCRDLLIARTRAIDNGEGNDTAVDAFAVENGNRVRVMDSVAEGGPGDGFDLKSNRTTVRRVVSLDMQRDGIKLWGRGSRLESSVSSGHGLSGLVLTGTGPFTVAQSLVANTRTYGYTAVLGEYESGEPARVRLFNTIFSSTVRQSEEGNGTLVYVSAGTDLDADHNLFFSPLRTDCVVDRGGTCLDPDQLRDGRLGAATLYGDPLFVDSDSDFHLRAGSPAIGAGSSAGAPSRDVEGNRRRAGSAPDIGPYFAR